MPRRVLVNRAGERFDLVETPAPNEHALQEVMKVNPQLIPADDLGLDSLDGVELAMAMEEEFDLQIDDKELRGLTTVGQALDFVQPRLVEKPA